jgi:hypothetical protein
MSVPFCRSRERRAEREREFGRKVTPGKCGVIIDCMPAAETLIAEFSDDHCLLLLGCSAHELADAVASMTLLGFTYKTRLIQALSYRLPVDDGFFLNNAIDWLLGVKGKGRVPALAMGTQWESARTTDDVSLITKFANEFFPSVPGIDLDCPQRQTDGARVQPADSALLPRLPARFESGPGNARRAFCNAGARRGGDRGGRVGICGRTWRRSDRHAGSIHDRTSRNRDRAG